MSLCSELVIATAAILFFSYWYHYVKNYRILKFCQQFAQPPTIPFIGNALDFTSTTAFLRTIHRYTEEYGNVVFVKIGLFKQILVVNDYKFLEFLLSTSKVISKSNNYLFFYAWLGWGLLLSRGSRWKTHRRIITPAFHFKILEEFIDVFESVGEVLVKKLAQQDGNDNFDIYPYTTLCTLDIICESAMGTKMNAQNDTESPYVQSVKEMCRILIERSMSPVKNNPYLYVFSRDYWKERKALKILHGYTNSVLDKKLEDLRNRSNESNASDVDDMGVRKKKSFLDLLLEASVNGQSLTREEVREQVDTFMFAGHDTTGTATSFILYCIANHEDVQEKIFEEQQHIFGDTKNVQVSYSNLQEMKYLEAVIKETLRLYPPVPVIGRETEEDVEFDNMVIPKGIHILIFIRGFHMNPEYFPNPEKFDPSRFENGNEAKLPYSFIPFSAGPRNCIGQKFAMLEMKSIISKVVRNFKLFPAEPHHEIVLTSETVLKSESGVNIGLKLRKI